LKLIPRMGGQGLEENDGGGELKYEF
jgi:hypothetical protein